MAHRTLTILTFCLMLLTTSCKENKQPNKTETVQRGLDFEEERKAILETLNNETKAAFRRDYDAWKEKWLHDASITKTYLDFADSTFSESVGWEDISQFVKTFMEEHPEPEPVPELLDEIDVKLYGNGAWVTYQLQDSLRGLKRETRLMEKVDGEWKIAGMQTSIYGFEKSN